MKTRVLPREEWSKLSVMGFEQIGEQMRPEDVQILVVEDDDRVIASMAVIRVTHLESLWIDPDYRGNAGMARKLLKASVEASKVWTDNWVWAASDTDHMNDVISRVGGIHLPVVSFMIPLGVN